MSDMSGGCAICHHNNPEGDILPCADCHSAETKRTDLSKPGLKGAYHRQCLSCHREWSHTTDCSICHALKSSQSETGEITDATDIIGIEHPPIPQPDKILYTTEADEGKLVTFYHDEHIQLYGLACVDCHTEESCSRCHDLSKPTLAEQLEAGKPVKMRHPGEDYHDACFSCHEDNDCGFCHAQKEQKPFNHQTRTGWQLKRYHANVSCQTCHPKRPNFSGLKSRCQNCHQGWNSETFKHASVGLSLDENHIYNDCSDCHTGNSYTAKPSCNNCHDDDIVYPASLPGKRTF
jgi:hypothetical protein